ncbi:kunitz-type protease inhibitor 3 isoform X1 [Phoca vitulina]|uniref:kunitz-type protease inhibitor 3 isoform X1 n=1 Tax=Phoca vitulina TaxID=9720 RepID=UPI0013961A42|nr:kunitz-type protease inhibitor 3 isoform X1 [Phoca vitulina]
MQAAVPPGRHLLPLGPHSLPRVLPLPAHLKQEAPWELSQTLPAMCQLPPARGPCRGLFYRYFYNNTSSECKHFAYGGCQGNDNNFETTEICLRICKHAETR